MRNPFRPGVEETPQPVNGKNGNYGGPKVRDRLCQPICQNQLDANGQVLCGITAKPPLRKSKPRLHLAGLGQEELEPTTLPS